MSTDDARFDIAHLGYVELFTPTFDESKWFFTELLGLREVAADGDSVYLRSWDDYQHHSLKLTAHDTSGIGRLGYRTSSAAALERRVAAIEAAGRGIGCATVIPESARPTRSPTPTGTRWTCTGRSRRPLLRRSSRRR